MISCLRGMPKHLENVEKVAFGKSQLDFLVLNVPPICNYQCKKCFTQAYKRIPKNALDLEKLFELIDKAKNLGAKMVAVIGEGEPLFDKRIKKILEYINNANMIPLIATNGSLLSEEMASFLIENNVSTVVSLDTLNEDDYKEFCGAKTDLSKVLKNIEYARKAYSKKIEINGDFRIHQFCIHVTVTAQNLDQVPKIKEFCADDIYFSAEHIAKVGEANSNPEIYGENSIYQNCKRTSSGIMDPMVLTKAACGRGACCLFNYGIAIGYEGEVMLDTHAVETRQSIGNINNESMESLISKAKELKKIYFEKYNGGYCLIRDDSYPEFLEYLKTKV